MRLGSDDAAWVTPCGINHVAVVTGDLDRYRAFYDDVMGLRARIVLGAGPGHGRQSMLVAGDVLLHVFEAPGTSPLSARTRPAAAVRCSSGDGPTTSASRSGTERPSRRFATPQLAVDATSGIGRRLGPMLSLRFVDPGGAKGEVNCLDPSFDPTSLRDEDEIVDPCWFEHTRRVLRSDR